MHYESRSLEAAAEAAAKVNAMLIAKGKLKPSQVNQNQSNRKSSSSSLVIAEVNINDVPIGCRNMLTRGSTQEEISKISGSAVSTRGRYMPMEERMHNPGDRSLYLCVQGPRQEAVDLAVTRINEIIQNFMKQRGSRFSPMIRPQMPGPRPAPPMNQPPPLMSLGPQPMGPTVTVIQEKLYIGLEHAPPSFDVKNKIIGVGASFLQHIVNETGAKISLRGRGSGCVDPATGRETLEPMHVHIQHTAPMGMQQAKQLAENLIQTVQQEYASFQQALAALPTHVNPGALIAGMHQQTSLPGHSMFSPQPGLAAIPQVATVQAPGLPHLAGHTGMMTPQGLPVSTPTSIVMSGTSLSSTMPSFAPNALLTPGLTVSSGGHTLMLPSSLGTFSAQMPIVTSIPVSGPSLVAGGPPPTSVGSQVDAAAAAALLPNTSLPPPMLQAQPANAFDVPITESQFLGAAAVNSGQPTHVILSQPPQQVAMQMAPGAAQLGQPGAGGPMASLGQPGVQLVTQGPPGMPPPGAPPLGQPQPQQFYSQYGPVSSGQPYSIVASSVVGTSTPATYTVATSGYAFSPKDEPPKRRFTEEKQEEKIPDNLLGYQHGPPHLTNLMASGPPPVSMAVTMVSTTVPLPQGPFPATSVPDDVRGPVFASQTSGGVVMVGPPPERPDDKRLMPPPGVKGTKRGHGGQCTSDLEKKSKTNLGYEDDEEGGKHRVQHPPPPPPPPEAEREHAELMEQEHREHLEREREFFSAHFPGKPSFRPTSPPGPARQSPPGPPPPPPPFDQLGQGQLPLFEQYSQNPQDQFPQGTQPMPQFEQYPPPPQPFHQQQLPSFSVSSSQSLTPFPHQAQSPQASIRPPEPQIIMSHHNPGQPPPPQQGQIQFQAAPFPPIPQNGFSQQFVGQQSQPPMPPPPPQSQFTHPGPPGVQYWMGPT